MSNLLSLLDNTCTIKINFPCEGKHVRFLGTVIIKRIKVSNVEQQAQSKRQSKLRVHNFKVTIRTFNKINIIQIVKRVNTYILQTA